LDLKDETRTLERARKEGRVVMQAHVIATFTSTTLVCVSTNLKCKLGMIEGEVRKVGRTTYESSIVTLVPHVKSCKLNVFTISTNLTTLTTQATNPAAKTAHNPSFLCVSNFRPQILGSGRIRM
jgi:hypothetical protein